VDPRRRRRSRREDVEESFVKLCRRGGRSFGEGRPVWLQFIRRGGGIGWRGIAEAAIALFIVNVEPAGTRRVTPRRWRWAGQANLAAIRELGIHGADDGDVPGARISEAAAQASAENATRNKPVERGRHRCAVNHRGSWTLVGLHSSRPPLWRPASWVRWSNASRGSRATSSRWPATDVWLMKHVGDCGHVRRPRGDVRVRPIALTLIEQFAPRRPSSRPRGRNWRAARFADARRRLLRAGVQSGPRGSASSRVPREDPRHPGNHRGPPRGKRIFASSRRAKRNAEGPSTSRRRSMLRREPDCAARGETLPFRAPAEQRTRKPLPRPQT